MYLSKFISSLLVRTKISSFSAVWELKLREVSASLSVSPARKAAGRVGSGRVGCGCPGAAGPGQKQELPGPPPLRDAQQPSLAAREEV